MNVAWQVFHVVTLFHFSYLHLATLVFRTGFQVPATKTLHQRMQLSSMLVCREEGGMGAVRPRPTPSTSITLLRDPSELRGVLSGRMTRLLMFVLKGGTHGLAGRDMERQSHSCHPPPTGQWRRLAPPAWGGLAPTA